MSKTVLPLELNGVRIHFVGIKGTGMAALVEIMYRAGAVISGSDVAERFYTDDILAALGIRALPFSEDNITDDIQFVVYSSAYSPAVNPDLIAAARRKIPCMLYTEALGAYSGRAYSAGICGVHGKTSTTGLAGTILKELPLPSQTLAGSVINSFGNGNNCTCTSADFSGSKNPYFVAETCEYQRHFMSFHPQKIVLTSVESDHQDFYPTFTDIQHAFVDYICLLPKGGDLIYCADDDGAVETAQIAFKKRGDIHLIPYGERADGDYRLAFGSVSDEKNSFSIPLLGDLYIRVPGKHEVRDAVGACALVCELLRADGKNPKDFAEDIKRGLANFSGGRRRSEVVGRVQNASGQSVIIIDDYAHHPTAIKTTLAGFREFYDGRKIIVDTYGGMGRHGGGAFSGKDPTKVDRSAAYMARYVAKNIVAAGFAERCELQLAYAIGVPFPVSVRVDTFGTATASEDKIEKAVREVFDLSPAGIITSLYLRKPVYQATAAYGHFGRPEFSWEKTDKVDALKRAIVQ